MSEKTVEGIADDEREAEIAKAWIDGPPVHQATIDLEDYSPTWPALFEREATRIRSVLGDQVVMIEHVGSTSVPGLAAKPIIDILLIVPDSSDESRYVPQMEQVGYSLRIREVDWFQHRLFKGPDTNINLHVFSDGCPEISRMLGFRDWLRTHDDDRALYESTKRDLAKRTWKYVQHYADAKTEVVEQIIARMNASTSAFEREDGTGVRLPER